MPLKVYFINNTFHSCVLNVKLMFQKWYYKKKYYIKNKFRSKKLVLQKQRKTNDY